MDIKENLSSSPRFRGSFTSKIIKALPNCQEGETIFNTDTQKGMIYKKGKWEDIRMEGQGLNMNLYDLNKSIVAQLPDIENLESDSILDLLDSFYEETDNLYYMLYGKEISYFTVFYANDNSEEGLDNVFSINVTDCLKAFKSVKSIDYTENKDAIEIWVSDDNDNVTCLYLFPYDNGVVYFKRVI